MYTVDKALLQGMYEFATPYDYCTAVEGELNHNTYYENMDNCSPIYNEPSAEIEKIYENFEGEILCSENIRYLTMYISLI